MEDVLSALDQQAMVSSFLEIAVGQSSDTARQFLQATGWKLEEAIQLFYVGNEGGGMAPSFSYSPPPENNGHPPDQSLSESQNVLRNDSLREGDENEVRAPLPVKREVLYDSGMLFGASRMGYPSQRARSVVPFRNFDEEMKRPGVWESEQGVTSMAESSRDNLASLYRPPFQLMYHGPFEKAKDAAKMQDRWLLVNLQSTREFSSHMLNRDTWANEALAQTIMTNFIFWQIYDDTEEGSKISTYYKLDSAPVILLIDPVTGQKMRLWSGMIQPENLLEDLLPYMDSSPKDHYVGLSHKRPRESSQAPPNKTEYGANEEDEEMLRVLAASLEGMKDTSGVTTKDIDVASTGKEEVCSTRKSNYPSLPEEPNGDRNLLCRVGVRLPDGRRLQRNFLRTDPIQLLWSFCYSELDHADTRQFQLTQAIPGASKVLGYDSKLTFDESGLANSMISVTWE